MRDSIKLKADTVQHAKTFFYWSFIYIWFAMAAVPILLTPLAEDETFYFYFSSFLKHGGEFFGRYWFDDKTGGMQFLYWLITPFEDGVWNLYAIRTFTVFYQAVTISVFYFLCKGIFARRPGTAKAVLPIFILFYLNPLVEGQFSNANNFVVLWILLAAYFFTVNRHLISALSIGVCFCLKQNTSLEILPSSLTLIWQGISNGAGGLCLRAARGIFVPLKQMVVFFVPICILFLYTVYIHTDGHFLRAAFFDRIQSHILHKDYEFAVRYFVPIFKQTSILWMGFSGYTAAFILRPWIFSKARAASQLAEGRHGTYIFWWVVFSSISVWVGGYFFPHYFIEIVPILILAASFFLLEIPAFGFYLLLFLSILFAQTIGAVVNSAIMIMLASTAFFESRARVSRNVLRLMLVFFCLLFTLSSTPFGILVKLTNSRNFLMNYTAKDMDILSTAKYLKAIKADKIFVYDYGMEIYCLSGIVPEYKYPSKIQYVNHSILIKNFPNYPSDGEVLKSRREELILKISRGELETIVVNYNNILPGEELEMRPIIKSMSLYKPDKIFGNFWVYKLIAPNDIFNVPSGKVSEVRIDQKDDSLGISISRQAFVADTEILLFCGDLQWRYPENGIVYPMLASQDQNGIEIKAALRGLPGGDCSLTLKNIGREESFKFRVPLVPN